METLPDRIERDGIRAESVSTHPPTWADDRQDSNWYSVTLTWGRLSMTVPFGMGPALREEPTAADVLNCLTSDASGYENARSFEEWASEYGYDTDSRKAEKIYRQVKEQTEQLRTFLGDSYDAYVWDTEGL